MGSLHSLADDGGEGVVIVDALVVHRFHGEGGNASISAQQGGGIPNNILYEDRVLVCLHRDETLVGALEQRVNRSGAGLLGDLYQVLDEDELPAAFFRLRTDFQGDVAA